MSEESILPPRLKGTPAELAPFLDYRNRHAVLVTSFGGCSVVANTKNGGIEDTEFNSQTRNHRPAGGRRDWAASPASFPVDDKH